MVNGQWVMKLKNGQTIPFYYDNNGEVSPLKRIKEFDKGDFWSVDMVGNYELLAFFKVDEDDDSFFLIPKSEVEDVYFEKTINQKKKPFK